MIKFLSLSINEAVYVN